jgi:hypothetical protein
MLLSASGVDSVLLGKNLDGVDVIERKGLSAFRSG